MSGGLAAGGVHGAGAADSHLVNPRPAEITDDLRTRRTALNIPIRVVALAVGENEMTISRLERGLGHDAELTRRYHTWITAQEAA